MAKTTPPLTAQERVILFCTATGVSHAAVGITAHAMQSMAIKGFLVHDRESGAYGLPSSPSFELRRNCRTFDQRTNFEHSITHRDDCVP